jgi:2-amino-4-hydroxy-6-hydroxymethyldihydropteridine diphosphokinase
MPHCLISLGSNLGSRREIIEEALAKLRRSAGVLVTAASSLRETPPIGGPAGQGLFLNAAAVLDTSLQPESLLTLLQHIEDEAGRRREEHWGPRTLDLDLLLYGEMVLSAPALEIPHPRMAWRRFVLEPAAEVAFDMRHPVIGWTMGQLLEHINRAVPYVALTGPIGVGKSRLAGLLREKTSARLISEPLDEKRLDAFYANPSSQAWSMELEFLRRREELLRAASPDWSDQSRLSVSDFWFDQSYAFARVWLGESQQSEFFELWREARQKVAQPKLLILLDAPTETLVDRIRCRGRSGEQYLTSEKLDCIRESICSQALQPGIGPVLKINTDDMESALKEIIAAIKAME